MDDSEEWLNANWLLKYHDLDFSAYSAGFLVRAPGWPLTPVTSSEVLTRFRDHGLIEGGLNHTDPLH